MADDNRATAEAWQAPWESRRGVFTTDYNNSVILIRASIDAVAYALAERTERWQRDVLGREIVLGGESAFVFRLRGHAWTELIVERSSRRCSWILASRGCPAGWRRR